MVPDIEEVIGRVKLASEKLSRRFCIEGLLRADDQSRVPLGLIAVGIGNLLGHVLAACLCTH